jgi:hypothetical protein
MIKVTIKDKEALSEITAEAAVKWLIKQKWTMTEKDKMDGKIIVGHTFYKTIGDNVVTVVVPIDPERKDYIAHITEMLYKVETTEQKSQLEIWAAMAGYKLALKKRPMWKDRSIKSKTGFARVGTNIGKF